VTARARRPGRRPDRNRIRVSTGRIALSKKSRSFDARKVKRGQCPREALAASNFSPKPGLSKSITYLLVPLLVAVEPLAAVSLLCFLLFFVLVVLFMVVSVVLVCAKTAVPERSERPRAAVMSFFIIEISPCSFCDSTVCALRSILADPGEMVLNFALNPT
jgi:hypothetical protein